LKFLNTVCVQKGFVDGGEAVNMWNEIQAIDCCWRSVGANLRGMASRPALA
jgi:hypothetical protein